MRSAMGGGMRLGFCRCWVLSHVIHCCLAACVRLCCCTAVRVVVGGWGASWMGGGMAALGPVFSGGGVVAGGGGGAEGGRELFVVVEGEDGECFHEPGPAGGWVGAASVFVCGAGGG